MPSKQVSSMLASTELNVQSTHRQDAAFGVALGNEHKQEQGLLWLLKGYLAADGELRSQTKGEGHPLLKAARVVQRSTKPSHWKKLRERKQSGPGITTKRTSTEMPTFKTSFYIIKTRKAGSIKRHRAGEVSQLPSTHQSNSMPSMRRQALQACASQQLQKLLKSGFRVCTMRWQRSLTD